MTTEITVPDGYELIPVGEQITEDSMVSVRADIHGHTRKWEVVGKWIYHDAFVQERGAGNGYLPYGYYCRPKVSKP